MQWSTTRETDLKVGLRLGNLFLLGFLWGKTRPRNKQNNAGRHHKCLRVCSRLIWQGPLFLRISSLELTMGISTFGLHENTQIHRNPCWEVPYVETNTLNLDKGEREPLAIRHISRTVRLGLGTAATGPSPRKWIRGVLGFTSKETQQDFQPKHTPTQNKQPTTHKNQNKLNQAKQNEPNQDKASKRASKQASKQTKTQREGESSVRNLKQLLARSRN